MSLVDQCIPGLTKLVYQECRQVALWVAFPSARVSTLQGAQQCEDWTLRTHATSIQLRKTSFDFVLENLAQLELIQNSAADGFNIFQLFLSLSPRSGCKRPAQILWPTVPGWNGAGLSEFHSLDHCISTESTHDTKIYKEWSLIHADTSSSHFLDEKNRVFWSVPAM